MSGHTEEEEEGGGGGGLIMKRVRRRRRKETHADFMLIRQALIFLQLFSAMVGHGLRGKVHDKDLNCLFPGRAEQHRELFQQPLKAQHKTHIQT